MPLLISLLMPLVRDIKRGIVCTPEKEGKASGRTGSKPLVLINGMDQIVIEAMSLSESRRLAEGYNLSGRPHFFRVV
jgi:hypothetical protein